MVSNEDVAYIHQLFPEIHEITDKSLAQKVVEIWVETWHASSWARIEDAPKNPIDLGDRKLVAHVRATVREAIAVARIIQEIHGIPTDLDLLTAGALLHDVCKMVEYSPTGSGAAKTRLGELVQHGVYSAAKVVEKGLSPELVHLMVSHTKGSNKPPATLECAILHYVDYADSDALLAAAHKPMFTETRR